MEWYWQGNPNFLNESTARCGVDVSSLPSETPHSSAWVISTSQRSPPDNTNTHNRQTAKRSAGFEPAIPAIKRPENQALNREVTFEKQNLIRNGLGSILGLRGDRSEITCLRHVTAAPSVVDCHEQKTFRSGIPKVCICVVSQGNKAKTLAYAWIGVHSAIVKTCFAAVQLRAVHAIKSHNYKVM